MTAYKETYTGSVAGTIIICGVIAILAIASKVF